MDDQGTSGEKTVTEEEWLAWTKTMPMLRYLLGLRPDELRVQDIEAFPSCRASDRKLRLFACACYHRIRHLLPDLRAAAAIEVVERVAEGSVPVEELQRAEARVWELCDNLEGRWRASRGVERIALLPTHEALALGLVALWKEAQKSAYYASSNAYLAFAALTNPGAACSDKGFSVSRSAEERVQTDLLRCIFGLLPFRQVTISPLVLSWNDAVVVRLAQAAYEERHLPSGTLDNCRLAILADALEEAGCTNRDILGHCRGPGPHVRGCWVVDLLLGKT
jgi:hypothetical protein